MARPKGSRNSQGETNQTSVGSETSNFINTQDEAQPQIAEQDMWRYHPDHEPRIFRIGEEIPEGWTGPENILGKIWQYDDTPIHGLSSCRGWVKVSTKNTNG